MKFEILLKNQHASRHKNISPNSFKNTQNTHKTSFRFLFMIKSHPYSIWVSPPYCTYINTISHLSLSLSLSFSLSPPHHPLFLPPFPTSSLPPSRRIYFSPGFTGYTARRQGGRGRCGLVEVWGLYPPTPPPPHACHYSLIASWPWQQKAFGLCI